MVAQQEAERLGYSPLPKTLVEFAFAAEKLIPGAPDPPALTAQACPNPTLDGSFYNEHNNPPPPGTEDPTGGSDGGTDGGGGGTGEGGTGTGNGDSTGSASDNGSGSGAGGTMGVDGTATVTASPAVLGDRALEAAKLVADQQIAGIRPRSPLPLAVAAAIVLLVVFAPLLLRLRSDRRS